MVWGWELTNGSDGIGHPVGKQYIRLGRGGDRLLPGDTIGYHPIGPQVSVASFLQFRYATNRTSINQC